jgi:hypothetical protein
MDDPTVNTSGRLNQNLNNRMELKRIPLDYILLKYVYIKNVQKKKYGKGNKYKKIFPRNDSARTHPVGKYKTDVLYSIATKTTSGAQ